MSAAAQSALAADVADLRDRLAANVAALRLASMSQRTAAARRSDAAVAALMATAVGDEPPPPPEREPRILRLIHLQRGRAAAGATRGGSGSDSDSDEDVVELRERWRASLRRRSAGPPHRAALPTSSDCSGAAALPATMPEAVSGDESCVETNAGAGRAMESPVDVADAAAYSITATAISVATQTDLPTVAESRSAAAAAEEQLPVAAAFSGTECSSGGVAPIAVAAAPAAEALAAAAAVPSHSDVPPAPAAAAPPRLPAASSPTAAVAAATAAAASPTPVLSHIAALPSGGVAVADVAECDDDDVDAAIASLNWDFKLLPTTAAMPSAAAAEVATAPRSAVRGAIHPVPPAQRMVGLPAVAGIALTPPERVPTLHAPAESGHRLLFSPSAPTPITPTGVSELPVAAAAAASSWCTDDADGCDDAEADDVAFALLACDCAYGGVLPRRLTGASQPVGSASRSQAAHSLSARARCDAGVAPASAAIGKAGHHIAAASSAAALLVPPPTVRRITPRRFSLGDEDGGDGYGEPSIHRALASAVGRDGVSCVSDRASSDGGDGGMLPREAAGNAFPSLRLEAAGAPRGRGMDTAGAGLAGARRPFRTAPWSGGVGGDAVADPRIGRVPQLHGRAAVAGLTPAAVLATFRRRDVGGGRSGVGNASIAAMAVPAWR